MGISLSAIPSALIATFQNAGNDIYKFDKFLAVGRVGKSDVYLPTSIEVRNTYTLVYVPIAFMIIGETPLIMAPDMFNGGELVAYGYKLSRGSYMMQYIDKGLQASAITRKDTATIGANYNTNDIFAP